MSDFAPPRAKWKNAVARSASLAFPNHRRRLIHFSKMTSFNARCNTNCQHKYCACLSLWYYTVEYIIYVEISQLQRICKLYIISIYIYMQFFFYLIVQKMIEYEKRFKDRFSSISLYRRIRLIMPRFCVCELSDGCAESRLCDVQPRIFIPVQIETQFLCLYYYYRSVVSLCLFVHHGCVCIY